MVRNFSFSKKETSNLIYYYDYSLCVKWLKIKKK